MCCGTDNPTSSRYNNDPRVTRDGAGFRVTAADGEIFHVLHTDVFAWTICLDDHVGTFVQTSGGGFAIGIDTADHAIGAIIGDPQPVPATASH